MAKKKQKTRAEMLIAEISQTVEDRRKYAGDREPVKVLARHARDPEALARENPELYATIIDLGGGRVSIDQKAALGDRYEGYIALTAKINRLYDMLESADAEEVLKNA